MLNSVEKRGLEEALFLCSFALRWNHISNSKKKKALQFFPFLNSIRTHGCDSNSTQKEKENISVLAFGCPKSKCLEKVAKSRLIYLFISCRKTTVV